MLVVLSKGFKESFILLKSFKGMITLAGMIQMEVQKKKKKNYSISNIICNMLILIKNICWSKIYEFKLKGQQLSGGISYIIQTNSISDINQVWRQFYAYSQLSCSKRTKQLNIRCLTEQMYESNIERLKILNRSLFRELPTWYYDFTKELKTTIPERLI